LSVDGSLLSAAIDGDEAAFDALVGPLIEPGYRLATVMLGDREEARDAVQDACVAAWRRLSQLRSESGLRPWFLTIVANRCRTVRSMRWWTTLRVPIVHLRGEVASDLESRVDLGRELQRLSSTDRAALFLFFYLDLSLAEVGEVLKISQPAAKSRVHRAVVKLRSSLAEVGE
jgi:RNA polymerase sigma-70 factor (ECF subfamily)